MLKRWSCTTGCPGWELESAGNQLRAAQCRQYGTGVGNGRLRAGTHLRGVRWGRDRSSVAPHHSPDSTRRQASGWIIMPGIMLLTVVGGRKRFPWQLPRRMEGEVATMPGRDAPPGRPDYNARHYAVDSGGGFPAGGWGPRANQAAICPPQPDRSENGPCQWIRFASC